MEQMDVAVTEWLKWLGDVRGQQPATIAAYERTMLSYAEWYGDYALGGAITAAQIEQFMQRPRRRGGRARTEVVPSAATQDRDRVCLRSFYGWAVQRGVAVANPTLDVGVPKVRNRRPRAVDDHAWSTLWGSEVGRSDRVWLGLGFYAGLRRQEIATVPPYLFDVKRGMIQHFTRKGGGTGVVEYGEMAAVVADRMPLLLPDLNAWLGDVEWLVQARQGERVLIPWDTPATPTARRNCSLSEEWMPDPGVLNDRLTALCKRVGVQHVTPHQLRHSCATNLLRCGVPAAVVADLLGHASFDTTRRYFSSAGVLAEWRRGSQTYGLAGG